MLRGLLPLIALSLLFALPAWARELPKEMDVAVLQRVELPYVELGSGGFSWLKLLTLGIADGNSAKFQVARGVRIKDENDRFMVTGRLTAQTGKPVAVRRDAAGVVREIWILTEPEAEAFKNKEAQREAAAN